MSTVVPCTCTGFEAAGDAELLDAGGVVVNAIYASRCFLDWYCPQIGFTWRWRDGIDPDDPLTWPPEVTPPPTAN